MVIPQMLINLTLPIKTTEWFVNFQKACVKNDPPLPEKK